MLHIAGAAAAGFAVGFLGSVAVDLWERRPVDWGRAAKTGAVSGVATGVAVATFGFGDAALAALAPEGIAATTGEAAVAGAATGYVACDLGEKAGRVTDQLLNGQPLTPGPAVSTGGLVCAATGGAGVVLAPVLGRGLAALKELVGADDLALAPAARTVKVQTEAEALTEGAARVAKFGHRWDALDLESELAKLGPVDQLVSDEAFNLGKTLFLNKATGRTIIYDRGGNYFRIYDAQERALAADGVPPPRVDPKLKANPMISQAPPKNPDLETNYQKLKSHFLNAGTSDEAAALAARYRPIPLDVPPPGRSVGFLAPVGDVVDDRR